MQVNNITIKIKEEENTSMAINLPRFFASIHDGSLRTDPHQMIDHFSIDIEQNDLWYIRDSILMGLEQIKKLAENEDKREGLLNITNFCDELQYLLIRTGNFEIDLIKSSYLEFLSNPQQYYQSVLSRRKEFYKDLSKDFHNEAERLEVLDND